ncbi:hypothetical protein N234_11605 [Ralstonia pickettii DTP0602]|nr:hypothetical protein N234_11605 [Ralstonia pickettii DTP0602]
MAMPRTACVAAARAGRASGEPGRGVLLAVTASGFATALGAEAKTLLLSEENARRGSHGPTTVSAASVELA